MSIEQVGQVRKFFEKQNLSTVGVGILTVQKNWTCDFFSVVVDFDQEIFLPSYNAPVGQYKDDRQEINDTTFNILTADNLERLEKEDQEEKKDEEEKKNKDWFCCWYHKPYGRIVKKDVFDQFFGPEGKGCIGHLPQYVFRLTKQVDHGKDLWTENVQLLHGEYKKCVEHEQLHKCDFYANRICKVHGFFYKVDVYSPLPQKHAHHLRIVPRTEMNNQVWQKFFD